MRAIVVALIVCAVVTVSGVSLRNHHHGGVLRAELRVFSGTRNPEWTLDAESANKVRALLAQASAASASSTLLGRKAPVHRLGYTGFVVRTIGLLSKVTVYDTRTAPELETVLLESGIRAGAISKTVADYMRTELARVHAEAVDELESAAAAAEEADSVDAAAAANCTIPVVGADNMTVYDPKTDDCGFFVQYETDNNCYDYGNDIVTNTFAQPGRGSGKKWSYNTCDDIRASAERDGLVWANTTLPTTQPKLGHYVALLIWPDTNFHWIRFDSKPAGYWSHKPGQTPVVNVDNNDELITDPAKSDFSPWTQFCGYMITVPSKVQIN